MVAKTGVTYFLNITNFGFASKSIRTMSLTPKCSYLKVMTQDNNRLSSFKMGGDSKEQSGSAYTD